MVLIKFWNNLVQQSLGKNECMREKLSIKNKWENGRNRNFAKCQISWWKMWDKKKGVWTFCFCNGTAYRLVLSKKHLVKLTAKHLILRKKKKKRKKNHFFGIKYCCAPCETDWKYLVLRKKKKKLFSGLLNIAAYHVKLNCKISNFETRKEE